MQHLIRGLVLLYPYGNNPLEKLQSIVTRLPDFALFRQKNPLGEGEYTEGNREKSIFERGGFLFQLL